MVAASEERLLLVDDEPQVLVALEDLLSEKFVVFKATSPESALELVQKQPDIAVVLTDQRMPRITGDDLLSRLPDSCHAMRIMVTGFADLAAVVRAVNDGRLFAYVTKPWDPADLRLKVDKAVEQFRLTRQLASERKLLQDLMESVPDGIYFKGRDLEFQRVNTPYSEMLGLESSELLVGKRLTELIADATHVKAIEAEERRILSEGIASVDVIRQGGQQKRWYSETRAPVRDPESKVVGLVGIARDVTERIVTQDALRASEERFRKQTQILNSILDGMGEGVIVTDRHGRFVLFNRRAEQILGDGPRDVGSRGWAAAYGLSDPESDRPLTSERDPLARVLAGEHHVSVELVRKGRNESRIIAVTATPLSGDTGELAGTVAVLRDVTEQRQLERQLLQSQKMEAIGRLAGGVAHDFNNLLAVIVSYAELLLPELNRPGDESKAEDVGEMLAAARRGAALTRQLLAFSRRQIVRPRPLSLNDVVTDIERMLRRVIGADVELVTKLTPALGSIKADAGQMEQIVLNLTVNARDAMRDGGRLTIATANVPAERARASARGLASGDHVALIVSDTGVGMDEETQKHIFEPFFTTKRVGEGTGLGLSTVYGILEQCGGYVTVSSSPGRGTTFTLYFPQAEGVAEKPEQAASTVAPSKGGEAILLVEDDDAVRKVAARILRDNGYAVLEARRPDDARAIARDEAVGVDLLLTDVVMPGVSGFTLAKELAALRPGMRVLYMSGYPDAAAMKDAVVLPDGEHLMKPFTPAALLERVRGALTGGA